MSEEQVEYNKLTVKENAPAALITAAHSLFFDVAKFEHAQRVAKVLMASTIVPDHFKSNIGNCIIALNYAERIKADPFMVMQNMYVVHGRPGIEGKLIIALINQSGKYSEPLKFEFTGTGDDYGCTAYTREAKSGEIVRGPKITQKLVKSEGWDKPKGSAVSKWVTMPDVMYRYRSASWFANTNCPELKLGMQTVEELNDFVDLQRDNSGKYSAPEPDPADTSLFDKFVSDKVHNQEHLLEFLAVAAKVQGKSVDEIKNLAQAELPNFWEQFLVWANRKYPAPGTQEAPKAEQRGKKGKDKLELKGEPMAPNECPDRENETMLAKFCNTQCKKRTGCPAWEPEPGSEG